MRKKIEIGKWLEFDAGTCFGKKSMHFGIIIGADFDKRVAVVVVNATSKIEKLIALADYNGIPIDDAMVDVTNDVHFLKPTGIDCHRPKEIPIDLILEWMEANRVRKSAHNEDVDATTLHKIVDIISRSPLVAKSIKTIVENT